MYSCVLGINNVLYNPESARLQKTQDGTHQSGTNGESLYFDYARSTYKINPNSATRKVAKII